jgi:hypothetical protein
MFLRKKWFLYAKKINFEKKFQIQRRNIEIFLRKIGNFCTKNRNFYQKLEYVNISEVKDIIIGSIYTQEEIVE